jgi:hypothetical protein
VQPVGHLGVADPEAGVEQEDAVRVPHGIAHHQTRATREVALGGVGEVGQVEGLDLDVGLRAGMVHPGW